MKTNYIQFSRRLNSFSISKQTDNRRNPRLWQRISVTLNDLNFYVQIEVLPPPAYWQKLKTASSYSNTEAFTKITLPIGFVNYAARRRILTDCLEAVLFCLLVEAGYLMPLS